jgi:hypothetical protein
MPISGVTVLIAINISCEYLRNTLIRSRFFAFLSGHVQGKLTGSGMQIHFLLNIQRAFFGQLTGIKGGIRFLPIFRTYGAVRCHGKSFSNVKNS